MFIEISNIKYSSFPSNLKLGVMLDYTIINKNEINFTSNIYVTRYNEKSESYNLYHRGYYLIDNKTLSVAEKNSVNFIDEFYEGKNILVKDLFTKYILNEIIH
jgi:hypothetical protein